MFRLSFLLLIVAHSFQLSVRLSTLGSTIVLCIWDTLVTLDQEVAHVWISSFGLPQFVFLLNRYGNTVCMIFANYST